MTLIVGVKCKDGIVVGSDGAATYQAMGHNTILQPTKKLTIISGRVIVGVSGAIGLGQRIIRAIDNLWTQTDPNDRHTFSTQSGSAPRKPHEAMVKVREKLAPHLLPELQIAAQAAQAVGQQAALQSAVAHTMLAVLVQGNPCLFQFDQQGAPEEATEQLPFISIGAGQAIADPFLAFIRRIFWQPSIPNLGDGIFAVLWTLEHAIKTHPGGVADPIQMAILTPKGARELTNAELAEHQQSVQAAEDALRNYKTSLVSGPHTATEPLPSPPTPPGKS